jgi:hypothetical protein
MTLPDLKHLDKIIALCRKRGVTKITMGDITLELGDSAPETKRAKKSDYSLPTGDDTIDSPDSLTQEQLLNWSIMDPSHDDREKIGS